MRLTVLGSNGTYPTPGRPASGYLVEHGDTRVWLDTGPGTFAALQQVTDPWELAAVLVSHQHADHCTDLLGFYHAVRYGARPRAGIPVYCPNGVAEALLGFLGGEGDHPLTETFDFYPTGEGATFEVGELRISCTITDHPVPTLATRWEAEGRALLYTSDTGVRGEWSVLAESADLLLAEATYQGESRLKPWPHHLTAAEAGGVARARGARSLMLTHLWPTLDPDRSVAEAEEAFGHSVALAVPGMRVKV